MIIHLSFFSGMQGVGAGMYGVISIFNNGELLKETMCLDSS